MASALERYYDSFGNVVVRDEDGNPSIFVRHPKQLSSDFDPSLPEHVHPAFTCGRDGSNNLIIDDAVLIGKYPSSQLVPGGRHYSLPNAVPAVNETYATQMSNCRWLAGNVYTTEVTVADYGLMVLTAHKKGIDHYSHGNTWYGSDIVYKSLAYETNKPVAVGDIRYYLGYEYTCIKAHTTSDDLLPNNAPAYWQRGKKIGGTMALEMADGWNMMTLTGSGPKNWYLYDDPAQEADMCGPVRMRICDLRIDNGEILIIPDNAAGDGSVDSTNSQLYRAILPHSNDNGFDFVAPGTEGTVHYDRAQPSGDGGLILKAGTPTGTTESYAKFNEIQIDTNSLPYVPYILYELGLAPIPGTRLNHWWAIRPNISSRYPTFGSRCHEWGDYPGHLKFDQNIDYTANTTHGARLRVRELASS